MLKITGNTSCGNSPKMEFLKEFNIAFAKGDVEYLANSVTDDVCWEVVGKRKIEGKEEFVKTLETMAGHEAIQLKFDKILSHGKQGAVNGIMKMADGGSYAFADFYEFSNAKGEKIKTMISYVIDLNGAKAP